MKTADENANVLDVDFFKKPMIRPISQLRPISIVELPIKNQRDNYQRTS